MKVERRTARYDTLHYSSDNDIVENMKFIGCTIEGDGFFKNCRFDRCDVKASRISECEIVFSSVVCEYFNCPTWVRCSDIQADHLSGYASIEGLYYPIKIGFPKFDIEHSWIAIGCETFQMEVFFNRKYMEQRISDRTLRIDLYNDYLKWYDIIRVFAEKVIEKRVV